MEKGVRWPHIMTIRLNDKLRKTLEDWAEEEEVSMTDIIRGLIRDRMERERV